MRILTVYVDFDDLTQTRSQVFRQRSIHAYKIIHGMFCTATSRKDKNQVCQRKLKVKVYRFLRNTVASIAQLSKLKNHQTENPLKLCIKALKQLIKFRFGKQIASYYPLIIIIQIKNVITSCVMAHSFHFICLNETLWIGMKFKAYLKAKYF